MAVKRRKIRIDLDEFESGNLPPVCMISGEDTDESKRCTFAWTPPVCYVGLIGGLLPYIILALVLRKKYSCTLPLEAKYHGYFWKRSLFSAVAVIGGFVSLFFGIAFAAQLEVKNPSLAGAIGIAGFVAMIVGLVAGVWISTRGLRVDSITNDDLTFVGVHPRFVEELEIEREAEREARRKRRERRYREDPDE